MFNLLFILIIILIIYIIKNNTFFNDFIKAIKGPYFYGSRLDDSDDDT